MSLHRLSHIEVGIPERALDASRAFYRDFGLVEVAPGRFATSDGGEQLGLVAAPRRALLALTVGVDDADDLARAASALAKLDVAAECAGDVLHTRDPATGIRVTLAIEPRLTQKAEAPLATNGPGRTPRLNARSAAAAASPPRPTRRPRAASSSTGSASA